MTASSGQVLDGHEYQRLMQASYEKSRTNLGRRQRAALQQCAFNLTIDYKLGQDFPTDRRKALWQAQKRVKRWVAVLLWLGLLRRTFGSQKPLEEPLYKFLRREYGKVLTSAETNLMLGTPPKRLQTTEHRCSIIGIQAAGVERKRWHHACYWI